MISPLDPQADNQVSADGHAAAAIISLRGSGVALQKLAPTLTQAAQRAATAGIHVSVTALTALWW
jgi:type IV pilus biogenesis protein CpaD/CtpE